MIKKIGQLLEKHIEKIVLVVVGLLCLWLAVTQVVLSPNHIEYGGKKLGPGDIDIKIREQAKALEQKMNRKPDPLRAYDPCFPRFVAMFDSAIHNIDFSIYPPVPLHIGKVLIERQYDIPEIGPVTDVDVEHIRAVAYVPQGYVNEEKHYTKESSEPNDIDLVSIEAKFNVAELYDKFYDSFNGASLKEQWRDPCLAIPVFSAVQLQRQEQLADGDWSGWQTVPRAKIEQRRRMFEIIEDVNNLPPGGIKVRRLQFDDAAIKADLLQPEAYMIASAKEDWLPPAFHREYLQHQKEIDAQERKDTLEKEQRERKDSTDRGRTREGERTRTRGAPGATGMPPGMGGGPMGGGGGPMGGGGGGGGFVPTATKRSTRTVRRDRKTEKQRPDKPKDTAKKTTDVYEKLNEILIKPTTDLAEMDEPLLLWAHDDTIEPGKSYRYRIRLGVFNPVAGTDQFTKRFESLKNKAVLWSEFSEPTRTVEIPQKLYVFPLDIQETTETVTVQVAKYVLGYWYSKDFAVKQGEVIGKVSEYKMTEEEKKKDVKAPQTIDYSTNTIVVDVVPVSDWAGKNLRERHYFDMLYSPDGFNMQHMAIKTKNWAEAAQNKFNEIKRLEKEPKEALRDWGSKVSRYARPKEAGPPGYGPPGYGPPGYGPPGYGPPGYGPPGR
jgi:hypothetical protein